jgi:hypothetical protein
MITIILFINLPLILSEFSMDDFPSGQIIKSAVCSPSSSPEISAMFYTHPQ